MGRHRSEPDPTLGKRLDTIGEQLEEASARANTRITKIAEENAKVMAQLIAPIMDKMHCMHGVSMADLCIDCERGDVFESNLQAVKVEGDIGFGVAICAICDHQIGMRDEWTNHFGKPAHVECKELRDEGEQAVADAYNVPVEMVRSGGADRHSTCPHGIYWASCDAHLCHWFYLRMFGGEEMPDEQELPKAFAADCPRCGKQVGFGQSVITMDSGRLQHFTCPDVEEP